LTLRIVCDTNVLVSAFIAAGPPSRVLHEVIDGRVDLLMPQPVIVELGRVLTGKLRFDARRWQQVEAFLLDLATELTPAPDRAPDPVTGDADDDVILACAVMAGADALVSGDRRHLLPLEEHHGVRIVTPQALLAELRGA
jgi:putative PIN family toxin of toxin-antitoxin system